MDQKVIGPNPICQQNAHSTRTLIVIEKQKKRKKKTCLEVSALHLQLQAGFNKQVMSPA
jgi:hypothetical protein